MLALWATAAASLPLQQSAEGEDDDARLVLTVGSKVIAGDGRSLCRLRLVVGSEQVALSHGDRATVQVYEDDILGDDEVYSEVLDFGPLEVGAGQVERVIDCSGDMGRDSGDAVELYARALVEKSDCGLGCRHDRPRTPSVSVEVVGDDGAEDDDASSTATALASGDEIVDRRALDEDWYGLHVPAGQAVITLELPHRAGGGGLRLRLEGSAGPHPSSAQITGDGARLSADVDPGAWFAVVSPAAANDPNFYDLRADVGPAEPQCTPGAESEALACGACGSTQRICDEQGRWGEMLDCQGEGACQPGDTREVGCERCARRTDTCEADCAWALGACEGQGSCDPGLWESEDCAPGPDGATAGVRTRVCRDHCAWSAFGPCRTGTEGGEGCPEGEAPSQELCEDGVDNDCDGRTDADDLDCWGCRTPVSTRRTAILPPPWGWSVLAETSGRCSKTDTAPKSGASSRSDVRRPGGRAAWPSVRCTA